MAKTNDEIAFGYCRNLPSSPERIIPREHLIEEVRRTLEGKTNTVLIIGDALSGKTEVLSSMYKSQSNSSIGVFLGSDPYLRSKDYIRLVVAEQISWIVDKTALTTDVIADTEYQRMLYRLQKHSRHSTITWLIDGLAVGENPDVKSVQEIFSLLPLSAREFSFVMTSECDVSIELKSCPRPPKTLDMMLVSPDEARNYLSDILDEEKDIQEIRIFCNSSIGRMSIVRTLLLDGTALEGLLEKQNKSLEALLELEWAKIPSDNEIYNAIAIILFSDRPISIEELAQLLSCKKEHALEIVKKARILNHQDNLSLISIPSRAQKRFAATKLAYLENEVRRNGIQRLLDTVNGADAIKYLPVQLAKSGQHSLLIHNLNSDHFIRLLEIEQTLRSLKQHADLGREAAKQLGEIPTEIAFSLISSIMTGLTLSVGRIEQIDAFTRLGLHELALEIASSAPTAEERLHLLARAVSGLDAKELPISEEIRGQLKQLAEEVGGDALGELGIDIAHDLLSVDVKLAESFLQQVVKGSERLANSTVEKQQNPHGLHNPDELGKEKTKSIGGKNTSFEIPEHKRRMFWKETRRRVRRLRTENLLRKLRDEDPTFSLLMCTTWLHGNKRNIDAPLIADAALDFMLANTTRTPRLQDLIEIARPLPFIKNTTQKQKLCDRLDTQYRTLGHHGTSVESVRLRMLLHRTRHAVNTNSTELALIDLFVEIQSINELSVRATCWAWMLFHLSMFEDAEELEKNTDIATLTSLELQKTLDSLLQSSANHFKVAKDALDALNRFNPELALDVISKLNTVDSRDKAYEDFARNLIPIHSKRGLLIFKALSSIDDDLQRNRAMIGTLLSIRRMHEEGDKDLVSPELLDMWRNIEVGVYRFQALLATTAFEIEANNLERAKELKEVAYTIWDNRAPDSTKIELGYIAARELADVDRIAATDWIERTEEVAKNLNIGSEAAIYALYCTVRLAARLLPSVISSDTSDEENSALKKIFFLASAIPTAELQVSIWSSLVVRLHFKGYSSLANLIVDRKISPLLSNDLESDSCIRDLLVLQAAPALYLTHQSSALYRIDSLKSSSRKDQARRNIITSIFQRTPHREPYSEEKEIEYWLDPKGVTDIVTILRQCKSDSLIFSIIIDLCRSLTADKNRARLQRNLVLDTLSKLDSIIDDALPDVRNIQHDGYSIICHGLIQAARTRVQRNSTAEVTKTWEKFYFQARNVPNVADRAVVTAFIGVNSHVRPESAVKNWLTDIRNDLSEIPAIHDKIDRHEWVSRIIQTKDKLASRILIADAIKISSTENATEDIVKMQRRLIDLAHAVDPRLAQDLVETFDFDEARQTTLKKQLEKNTKKKEMASKPGTTELVNLDDSQVSEICHENLGALLAGRIGTRTINEFRELSARARAMPIQESLSAWEWIIENTLRKPNPNAKSIDTTCSQLFDATCRAGEITQGLIGRINSSAKIITKPELSTDIFKVGDREAFVSRIVEWGANCKDTRIWISDPYFAPTDISFLHLLHEACPSADFRILTSREHMKKNKIEAPEDAFLDAWQERFDTDPPKARFGIVGFGVSGKHPIHDRWVVAQGSGIRLGSSINSIGLSRISDISEIDAFDAAERVQEIEYFFNSPSRIFASERLSVSYFDLN